MEKVAIGNELNVLIGDINNETRDLFFHTQEGDEFIQMSPETTWEDIVVHLNMFPSKSQARKNGWSGDVSEGWTQKTDVGKMNWNICILKGVNTVI